MLEPNGRSRRENPSWRRTFAPGRLTLGLLTPIEAFSGDRPSMERQDALVRRAEELGFAAVWVRDVPLRDPDFGDLGQVFDPWVYLGRLSALTSEIALGTAAVILPFVHPLAAAKKAASLDQLTRGRFLFGVASGDRPVEFPAFGQSLEGRGELFREHVDLMQESLARSYPVLRSRFGDMAGADLVPKPYSDGVPLFVVGCSRQELSWIADRADGWITYPREPVLQRRIVARWREAAGPGRFKPIAQSLYIDLASDPDAGPSTIHLGWRLGRNALVDLLAGLEQAGMNHVLLNLKYGRRPAPEVLEELGEFVVPRFPSLQVPAV